MALGGNLKTSCSVGGVIPDPAKMLHTIKRDQTYREDLLRMTQSLKSMDGNNWKATQRPISAAYNSRSVALKYW